GAIGEQTCTESTALRLLRACGSVSGRDACRRYLRIISKNEEKTMANEEKTAANAGRRFGWSQILVIICAVAIVALGYSLHVTRNSFEHRVADLEASLDATSHELTEFRASSEGQATELVTNVDALTKRVGVTAGDLQKARQQLAQRMKQQQELVEQKLVTELAAKA